MGVLIPHAITLSPTRECRAALDEVAMFCLSADKLGGSPLLMLRASGLSSSVHACRASDALEPRFRKRRGSSAK